MNIQQTIYDFLLFQGKGACAIPIEVFNDDTFDPLDEFFSFFKIQIKIKQDSC